MALDKRCSAALLLGVFLMGGLLCPCRGLAGAIERYMQQRASEHPQTSCACCHKGEESKGPEQPPRDCECLSGCCDAYLPPSTDSEVNLPAIDPCCFASTAGTETRFPEFVAILSLDPHRFRPPEKALRAELCSFRI